MSVRARACVCACVWNITNQKWRSPNSYLAYTHISVSFHLVQCSSPNFYLAIYSYLNFLAPPILGPIFLKAFSQLPNPLSVIFPKIVFLKLSFVATIRGVARNTYLGGPGCNRDIPNIIFKSIGYKIINFHILLYTWTCWEFNRNFKLARNKKIEKTKRQK